MEFFLILLVFGISYAISASVGHYFIYSDENDAQISSLMGYDEMQRLKIYENAALHAREVVFVINQRLQVITRVGSLTEEDVLSFKNAYIDDNPTNLSVLQDIFTSDEVEAHINMLPERLFFMNRKWNIKNVFDKVNLVLYVYLIDEDTFKYMIIDIADLASIYDCERTSVADRLDEYLLKTRELAIENSESVMDLKEIIVRKLKLLIMHIAEMDLSDSSENISSLVEKIISYRKVSKNDFIADFSEEHFLSITKNDRERLLKQNEHVQETYELYVKQGSAFERYDSYFERDDALKDELRDILLKVKQDHFRLIVDTYVDGLVEKGPKINRKLKPLEITFDCDHTDIQRIYPFMSDILPMIESELMHVSQSPSERLRKGRSEYAQMSIHLEGGDEQEVRLFLRSDGESLDESLIRELTNGRYTRNMNVISGRIVQDESKQVMYLSKVLKVIEQIGGKVEFRVDPGVSTEFIFTIPQRQS